MIRCYVSSYIILDLLTLLSGLQGRTVERSYNTPEGHASGLLFLTYRLVELQTGEEVSKQAFLLSSPAAWTVEIFDPQTKSERGVSERLPRERRRRPYSRRTGRFLYHRRHKSCRPTPQTDSKRVLCILITGGRFTTVYKLVSERYCRSPAPGRRLSKV